MIFIARPSNLIDLHFPGSPIMIYWDGLFSLVFKARDALLPILDALLGGL
ncbi:hypothetical protein J7M28_09845 [bacterium]|nr:hypothetical protein [bacterium]